MLHHCIWSPLLLVAVACPAGPPESPTAREQAIEITREQAIEIARQEVSFQPDSVEAVLSKSGERR